MRPEVDAQDFVKFNYWDGGRKGLLSGEALYLDLKRMEMAYHDNNKRELELTKARVVAPTQSGRAAQSEGDRHVPGDDSRMALRPRLPRSLYAPHQKRRPLNSIRRRSIHQRQLHPLSAQEQPAEVSDSESDYARQGSEDDRFVDYIGAVQSIVTSSGQNDSGMFETNLRDERFLPFEGAGAESTWKLDLPQGLSRLSTTTRSPTLSCTSATLPARA